MFKEQSSKKTPAALEPYPVSKKKKQSPTVQEDESVTDINGDCTNHPEAVVGSVEDSLFCDVYTDMADHLIMCDRCEIQFCYRYAEVDWLIYVPVKFKELHWLCKKCDGITIRALILKRFLVSMWFNIIQLIPWRV